MLVKKMLLLPRSLTVYHLEYTMKSALLLFGFIVMIGGTVWTFNRFQQDPEVIEALSYTIDLKDIDSFKLDDTTPNQVEMYGCNKHVVIASPDRQQFLATKQWRTDPNCSFLDDGRQAYGDSEIQAGRWYVIQMNDSFVYPHPKVKISSDDIFKLTLYPERSFWSYWIRLLFVVAVMSAVYGCLAPDFLVKLS